MAHDFKEFATFCKKKGFIYQSSEIYGSIAGIYDYGHLGTLIKQNFENVWRKYFLSLHDNFWEIDAAEIMHENVFKASGHLENFVDPIVKCTKCDFSERADHLVEQSLKKRVEDLSTEELSELIHKNKIACPHCKSALGDVTVMNMMFPLEMGVGSTNKAYLRPETAQSPFVNFKLQYEILRKKMPLGLALIGRAYRNEISPRNLTLRQRAFTQAELQIFFNPDDIALHPDFASIKNYSLQVMRVKDRSSKKITPITAQELVKLKLPQFYVYHLAKIQQFFLEVLHIPQDKFRLYELNDKEKAFYNKYHFDIEVELAEHGFTEVGGLHYRTDHDLAGHQKVSKEKMGILDEQSGKRYIPHVLEISLGVDRCVYSLLDTNYGNDTKRGNVILHTPKKLSPFYCAIFPLVKNKEPVANKAKEVYALLKQSYSCYYDQTGSMGRRYARADEVGVPFCITIDFETLDDECVTLRDRDTAKQVRVKISELTNYLFEQYSK
jgi:glycyl-tRNA synthetase